MSRVVGFSERNLLARFTDGEILVAIIMERLSSMICCSGKLMSLIPMEKSISILSKRKKTEKCF